jgi:hypothetical protein
MTIDLQRTARHVLGRHYLAIGELTDPYAHHAATDAAFSFTWVDWIDSHPLSFRSRDCSACVAS